jgi:hypothetical protein
MSDHDQQNANQRRRERAMEIIAADGVRKRLRDTNERLLDQERLNEAAARAELDDPVTARSAGRLRAGDALAVGAHAPVHISAHDRASSDPRGTDMRSTMTVARHPTSFGSYLIGGEVLRILSSIEGITAVRIDRQYLEGASLSYESADRCQNFDRIDQMLDAVGMRRV